MRLHDTLLRLKVGSRRQCLCAHQFRPSSRQRRRRRVGRLLMQMFDI